MEKIKSVLHGHKKDEDAHDTSSSHDQQTTSHHGHSTTPGQPHYNIQTTSGGPYTDLAQPSDSRGLHGQEAHNARGRPAQVGTDGPIGQSTATGDDRTANSTHTGGLNPRPDAHPHSHNQDASVASIKSGIIGFGPEETQGHAAMARHNPTDQAMDPNQVVGAGEPGTAGRMQGSNLQQGYDAQQSNPQTGAIGRDPSSANPAYTREQQPYENTLRQESYTADTDRSFPLAGGVTSTHHDGPTSSTRHPEHTSALHNKSLGEREPGTKEKRVGFEDDNLSRDGHGREALAGAAAAATGVAASKTLSRSEERDVHDQGLETRQATYGGEPPAVQAPSGNTSGPTTSTHNPAALAAATTAALHASTMSPPADTSGARDGSLPVDSQTTSAERPQNPRLESRHRHVPGEFPETPAGEPNTFLDYNSAVEPAPLSSGRPSIIDTTPTIDPKPTSTLDPTTSQRTSVDPTHTSVHPELRHTGTLDEPQPRSSEEHHHGRDAAIAGGLGAGAAGLGMHAASRKHDTPDDGGSKPLYEETNPYSSKTIDPRVAGTNSTLGEQRFDPQARTGASPGAQMSDPSGSSAVSGPPVTRDAPDSQHHYGRDAAVPGTGAVAAGGLHHALQRDDTPNASTAVPSQDTTYTSGSGSASAVPDQTSNFSKPLPTSGASATQQPSGGKDAFYGTPGAPAPVADTSAHPQQPSSNVGHTSATTQDPERDSEHHYGRNAGLVGAAGAATAGGLYAANRNNRTDDKQPPGGVNSLSDNRPASNTMDPYSSSANTQHSIGSTPENPTTAPYQAGVVDRADPRVDETAGSRDDHHYGRNAAAVGGAGAAGYGAYEAAKAYGDHRLTQPGASMEDQRYDPTASNARAPNPIPGTSEYNYHDPNTISNVNRTDPNDHVNRNAALGGAGLAAAGAGAGAYAGSRHNNSQELPLRQKQDITASSQPQSSYPTQDPTYQQPHDSAQNPTDESHDKRNAALAGTAGAAGLGGAAYAYSQRDDNAEAAKRDALMKEKMDKEQQDLLKKDAHNREKDQHKLEKEQHKHEKAEEHRLAKEQEKEQARLAKEQREREKEAEKETEGEEKKKGGLLGFLHRDKSKKEKSTPSPDSSPRQSRDYSPRQSLDDNNPESPRWKGKHRLHKDPPKGHPAREAMEHPNEGDHSYGKREHVGTDGAIGDPNMISGDRETRKGVYGAHPTSGLDRDNTVTDPHTGLPMNVGRFGSGAGGTDGNPAIRGHHEHPGGQTTTDWDAVKKTDTPY